MKPELLGLVVRAGQSAPRAVPPPPEAVLRAVRAELDAARRRRRWMRVGAALAAGLAACVTTAAALWPRQTPRPDAAVTSLTGLAVLTPEGGTAIALASGMGVAEGGTVTTLPGGTARLELKSGTELSLSASAELAVERLSKVQRFRLGAGRANVHVAPLEPGERFLLATEDVEIEVHGTRFEVESTLVDAACDVATATRIAVTEGVVEVRRGADRVRLEAPAQWPDCRPGTVPELEPEPEAVAPAPEPAPRVLRKRATSLNELNARYREAIAAKRRGDTKAALQLFDDFYRLHPKSQLAEAARVEALRLLARFDAGRARTAAQEYLGLYPNGFARDEASAVLQR